MNRALLHQGSQRQIFRRAALSAYVVSIGVLGLAPHVAFSRHVDAITYFQYAYDEPFYATLAVSRAVVPGRILSAALFRALYHFCGGSMELALILSDIIFPCACAVAALYAAACVAGRPAAQLLVATLLLFGAELLSLTSAAVWTNPSFTVLSLREALGPRGAVLIPNSFTTFFAIFRTSEPQATWPLVFLFLGFSYRLFTKDPATIRAHDKVAFVLLCASSALGYVFCAFAILLFAALLLLESMIVGPKTLRPAVLAGLSVGVFVFLLPVTQIVRVGSLYSSHEPFASRLPSLSVSVVASLFLLGWCWMLSRWSGVKDPRLHLLFIIAALPFILMEQQVVSGVMVLTTQWERFINYQFVAFGAAIAAALYGLVRPESRLVRVQRLASPVILLLLAYVVVRGQNETYRMWLGVNDESVAQQRAVEDAIRRVPDVRRIVVEHPSAAALLAVRLPPGYDVLADYGGLVTEPIDDMPADGSPPRGRERHLMRLFEYLARTEKTTAWLSSTLAKEADTREGFYLGFLFSFKDFWGPFTDYRRVRVDAIKAQIPLIVDRYQQYLHSLSQKPEGPAIYLSSNANVETESGCWEYRLIGKGAINSTAPFVMRAYLQTPRTGDRYAKIRNEDVTRD